MLAIALDASWLAATASVASAMIVAVTVIAAFLQIRHVRNANDITVYLRLSDRLESLDRAGAFTTIDPFLQRLATDSTLRFKLTQRGFVEEFANIQSLLRFLEQLATLVVTGGVSERLIFAEYADNIESLWDRLAQPIFLRRIALGPYVCAAFEHLAMRAKDYIAGGEMDRLYGRLRKDPRMSSFVRPHADES